MLPYFISDACDEMTLFARVVRACRPAQTLRVIMIEVAQKHGLTPRDLVSTDRSAKLVLARHEYFYRALSETTKAAPQIAALVAREHSTALYGAARHALRNGLEIPRRDQRQKENSYQWKKLQKFLPPQLEYQGASSDAAA